MITVDIHEAKTRLSELLDRVMTGEEIIIAKSGEPIVVISPIKKKPEPRVPGIDAGKVFIHENFDDPLPEFAF